MAFDLTGTLDTLRAELKSINAAIAACEKVLQRPERPKTNRGRKSMGAEERRQVSERMTKYWAQRRNKKKRNAS